MIGCECKIEQKKDEGPYRTALNLLEKQTEKTYLHNQNNLNHKNEL